MANLLISMQKLSRKFYIQDTIEVARQLIGKLFIRKTSEGTLSGRIVETEAYLKSCDLASHSAPGITNRNQVMFREGGNLYVYLIYGIHYCANVVTENEGAGCAVLIRAAEPIEGIDLMKSRRNSDKLNKLCSGPGNFAKAFGINSSDNGISLMGNEIYIVENSSKSVKIKTGNRVGISKSADLILRFADEKSASISREI